MDETFNESFIRNINEFNHLHAGIGTSYKTDETFYESLVRNIYIYL